MPSNKSEFFMVECVSVIFLIYCMMYCPFSAGGLVIFFSANQSSYSKYNQLEKCLVFGDFNRRTVTSPYFCGNDENLSNFISDISDSI